MTSLSPARLLLGLCLLFLLWAAPTSCTQRAAGQEVPSFEWPSLPDAAPREPRPDADDAGEPATCLPTRLAGTIGRETVGIQRLSIAGAAREAVTVGATSAMARWSVEDGTLRGWFRGHTKPVRAVSYSPDERWLVSGGDGTRLRVWERSTGKEVQRLAGHDAAIQAVAWASDSETFASSAADGTLRLWKRGETASLRTLRVDEGTLLELRFSGDGRWLAALHSSGAVRLWDRRDWDATPAVLAPRDDRVSALAFSSDSKLLSAGSVGGAVLLWETGVWKKRAEWKEHAAAVTALAFRAGDTRLTTVDRKSETIRVWDVPNEKLLFSLVRAPREGEFRVAAFGSGGRFLGSAAEDILRFRTLPTGALLVNRSSDDARKDGLLFTPDGARLMGGGNDGEVRLWDTATGREIKRLRGHKAPIQALGWNEDDKNFVSAAGSLRWWDPSTGRLERRWESGPVASLGFSREAFFLLTGDLGHVRLWQVSSGFLKRSIKVGDSLVTQLATHPTQNLVAVAVGGGIQVWDWDQGSLRQKWEGHAAAVTGLAFSPDGVWLASTSSSEEVWLWRVGEDKPARRLTWKKKGFSELRFHPSGKYLLGASQDGTVLFWNLSSGAVVRTLPPQLPLVRRLKISGDGRWVATSSSGPDGSGRVTWWSCE